MFVLGIFALLDSHVSNFGLAYMFDVVTVGKQAPLPQDGPTDLGPQAHPPKMVKQIQSQNTEISLCKHKPDRDFVVKWLARSNLAAESQPTEATGASQRSARSRGKVSQNGHRMVGELMAKATSAGLCLDLRSPVCEGPASFISPSLSLCQPFGYLDLRRHSL